MELKRHMGLTVGITCLLLGVMSIPKNALAAPSGGVNNTLSSVQGMLEGGTVSGSLRTVYFAGHNEFFANPGHYEDAAALGGFLNYTSGLLDGFSFRVGLMAQGNYAKTTVPADSVLAKNVHAIGETWIQWEGKKIRLRVGNQLLSNDIPFTGTYDYRVVPQVYQGVTLRYGSDKNYVEGMRILRFKSRIGNSYTKTTNYNSDYDPFSPVTATTQGFWAIGGHGGMNEGPLSMSGTAWYFQYMDYAKMFYGSTKVATLRNTVNPFLELQYIRETGDGRQLLGNVNASAYGIRVGITHRSMTLSLNYDHFPHKPGAYLNGALVTPYAHNVTSGPLFAQPLMTSTQDLGTGDAYGVSLSGSPLNGLFMIANYSYMDLTATPHAPSIGQPEYNLMTIYHFHGWLKRWQIEDFVAYQKQRGHHHSWLENRLHIVFTF